MIGAAILIVLYGSVLALHVLLPGRWVDGYVKGADGRPLRYRLNGLRVFFVVIGLYATLVWRGVISADLFYLHRWSMLATASAIGLAFTSAIVVGAAATGGHSLLAQFYLGRRENPQALAGRLDAKMFLYLVGALILELNLLSFAAHHVATHPDDPSPGVYLYVALFSFFIIEYLNFEEVHLYTYDFFAERVGFKLGWGCLVFYPFFYGIGLWSDADHANPHTPKALLLACAVLFFAGWSLARGANMQKFYFKTRPGKKLFGIEQEALEADGHRLLVSGFWGLSRHINYLGEILMATALTLSLGHPSNPWPWLYPLYYVALLFPRQAADDQRCREKYGPLWKRYCERVPYRIIPWIY